MAVKLTGIYFYFTASAVISVVFLKETVRASDIVGKHKHSLEDHSTRGHVFSQIAALIWEHLFRYIPKWLHRSSQCEKTSCAHGNIFIDEDWNQTSNPQFKKSHCSLLVPVKRKNTIYSTDLSYFIVLWQSIVCHDNMWSQIHVCMLNDMIGMVVTMQIITAARLEGNISSTQPSKFTG